MLLLNIYHTFDSNVSDEAGPLHDIFFKPSALLIVKKLFSIREKLYFNYAQKCDLVDGTE